MGLLKLVSEKQSKGAYGTVRILCIYDIAFFYVMDSKITFSGALLNAF